MTKLVLYTKSGCHLCHEAAVLLDRLSVEYDFTVQEIDITQDTALQAEYGDSIPVVEAQGKPLLAAPFGEAVARKALEQLARRSFG